jgi:hypothetical protein
MALQNILPRATFSAGYATRPSSRSLNDCNRRTRHGRCARRRKLKRAGVSLMVLWEEYREANNVTAQVAAISGGSQGEDQFFRLLHKRIENAPALLFGG